jgi:hypothetical protein
LLTAPRIDHLEAPPVFVIFHVSAGAPAVEHDRDSMTSTVTIAAEPAK